MKGTWGSSSTDTRLGDIGLRFALLPVVTWGSMASPGSGSRRGNAVMNHSAPDWGLLIGSRCDDFNAPNWYLGLAVLDVADNINEDGCMTARRS